VWLFYTLVVTARAMVLGFAAQGEMAWRRMVVSAVGIAITYLLYLLLRKLDGRSLGIRIASAALLALPCAFTVAGANFYMFNVYDPGSILQEYAHADPDNSMDIMDKHEKSGDEIVIELAEQSINRYFLLIAWAALYFALGFASRLSESERRRARLELATRQAELKSLRYQVNPHFLFNTLNSLSSLVMSDRRDEAETMIMNLAHFYRTSLAGDPLEDVRLSEEVELQRLYLGIEAIRFPERLRTQIEVPPQLANCCVPGLILQPLIENAIKYGVSPARRIVTVQIRAHAEDGRLHLIVEDDGTGPTLPRAEGNSTGIGLRNVRERLAARFGDEAALICGPGVQGGYRAEVILPMPASDNCSA
jgi:two-component sensor histidine kinase